MFVCMGRRTCVAAVIEYLSTDAGRFEEAEVFAWVFFLWFWPDPAIGFLNGKKFETAITYICTGYHERTGDQEYR